MLISENTGKFLLRDLGALTNSIYCNSQCEALMNRFPVMMTLIGWRKFPTIFWYVYVLLVCIISNIIYWVVIQQGDCIAWLQFTCVKPHIWYSLTITYVCQSVPRNMLGRVYDSAGTQYGGKGMVFTFQMVNGITLELKNPFLN